MLPRCPGAVTANSCSAGEEGEHETNSTKCCDSSDVRLPCGRFRAVTSLMCCATPASKTSLEFRDDQAAFQASPWARTRLFPVRILRPRCKASCTCLLRTAAIFEEGKQQDNLQISMQGGDKGTPSLAQLISGRCPLTHYYTHHTCTS